MQIAVQRIVSLPVVFLKCVRDMVLRSSARCRKRTFTSFAADIFCKTNIQNRKVEILQSAGQKNC